VGGVSEAQSQHVRNLGRRAIEENREALEMFEKYDQGMTNPQGGELNGPFDPNAEPEIDCLAHPYGVQMIGPVYRDPYDVVSGGYSVPHLTAMPLKDKPGHWVLTLDRRFSIECEDLEMRKWVWFVANAMALGAGYPCHGAKEKFNPFRVRVSHIGPGDIEPEA
jgi:hypothetical protein